MHHTSLCPKMQAGFDWMSGICKALGCRRRDLAPTLDLTTSPQHAHASHITGMPLLNLGVCSDKQAQPCYAGQVAVEIAKAYVILERLEDLGREGIVNEIREMLSPRSVILLASKANIG